MDGTNRSVIVEEKITWPNGLTLDFVNDRIYWADAREDYIAFASLDGSNRHTSNTLFTLFVFICLCLSQFLFLTYLSCMCFCSSGSGYPPHLCHDSV